MSNVETPSPWFPPRDDSRPVRRKGGGDVREFAYGVRHNIYFLNSNFEAVSKEEHDSWSRGT